MTEIDELLSRLRKLEPIALDREFMTDVQQRARRRVKPRVRATPWASCLVFGTAFTYLAWALQFTSALYR